VSERRDVVVVGGGLAGIAAALDCAAAGASVTLVEVRRRLGGAAYSVDRDGLQMDNGQHVFLRGCLAYRELLARLGSERHVRVQERLEIPVLSPGRAPYRLRRSSLPAPAHLGWTLARYPLLPLRARLSVVRAALALMRAGRAGSEDLAEDRETLGAWLARHGQGPEAIAALWDLIALPTLNLPAEQASLALGEFVFRRGLLTSASDGDIGFHAGTLAQVIGGPAEAALARAGVEVRLGWRAQSLVRVDGGVEVGGQDGAAPGDGVRARCAVVALPHNRAAGLLEPLLGEQAARWRGLGASPIVNLHVVYDRVVCDEPFAAGVRTPVQYLFDRSAAAGAPPGCQYLAVSLSGAEREMSESVEDLRARYIPALEQLLPRARGARVESFLVTREHAATFRAAPGVGALRPAARTPVPELMLAGAWTDTGWPATLEGAVLSGREAAAGALAQVGLARSAAAASAQASAAAGAGLPGRPGVPAEAAP
jgi:squalene-associated FAD-dependent desaturase